MRVQARQGRNEDDLFWKWNTSAAHLNRHLHPCGVSVSAPTYTPAVLGLLGAAMGGQTRVDREGHRPKFGHKLQILKLVHAFICACFLSIVRSLSPELPLGCAMVVT